MLLVTRKGKGHLTAHGRRRVAVVAARGAARGVVAARRALLGCSLASSLGSLTCHFIFLREIII